ncbi:actin-binding LIM protein 3-like isoform X1, partial [Lates japonicus]
DVLDAVELRTRHSSSSAFTDSPAHSRHGGSPLHYYLPGNAEGRAGGMPCSQLHGIQNILGREREREPVSE